MHWHTDNFKRFKLKVYFDFDDNKINIYDLLILFEMQSWNWAHKYSSCAWPIFSMWSILWSIIIYKSWVLSPNAATSHIFHQFSQTICCNLINLSMENVYIRQLQLYPFMRFKSWPIIWQLRMLNCSYIYKHFNKN